MNILNIRTQNFDSEFLMGFKSLNFALILLTALLTILLTILLNTLLFMISRAYSSIQIGEFLRFASEEEDADYRRSLLI